MVVKGDEKYTVCKCTCPMSRPFLTGLAHKEVQQELSLEGRAWNDREEDVYFSPHTLLHTVIFLKVSKFP